MSRELFDIMDQTDDVLHEIRTCFNLRFVINSTHTLTSTVTPPCCSNSTRNEDQQNHSLLLGVKLTGYRLLNMVGILLPPKTATRVGKTQELLDAQVESL